MDLIESIIKNKTTCFFVSPHLDDAAFSAGGLIYYLSDKVDIIVINVFTNSGDGKNTLSAKAYLEQCQVGDPKRLFDHRIAEDYRALTKIDVRIHNLDYTDALWREIKHPGVIRKLIGKFIPELNRLYPTYRFNVISGKFAKEDEKFIYEIGNKIKSIIKDENVKIFCPIGFGNHVDHILVRDICHEFFDDRLVYWSDIPYCLQSSKINNFIKNNHLKKYIFEINAENKIKICESYVSQISQTIKDKKILRNPEIYYINTPNVNNKKLHKLSIGIPAYNEEQNIKYLIDSIINQKQKSYILENIFVISDGSTDNTENIVNEMSKNMKNILLIADGKRKGKTIRLNQLLRLNKSEILACLDADVILSGSNVLEKMSTYFNYKKTALLGFNLKAIESKKFVGKLINNWERIWYKVRKNINNGSSIHNIRGGAFAVRKSLIQKVTIPSHIQQVARYLYHHSDKSNLNFVSAKDAVVLYRTPDNFSDYVSTLSRGDNAETNFLEKTFGKDIHKKYTVPTSIKIKVIAKILLMNPFSTIISFLFVYFARFWAIRRNSLEKPGIWKVTSSTKKAINNIHF